MKPCGDRGFELLVGSVLSIVFSPFLGTLRRRWWIASSVWTWALLGLSANSQDMPHPWLGSAPPAIARLVNAGHVAIRVDEEAVQQARRTALTIFRFTLRYRMRYQTKVLGKTADGKTSVRVQFRFLEANSTIEHDILLSERYQPEQPWSSPLLLHEFDHVAISTDPRLLAMLRSLDSSNATVVVAVEPETKLDQAWAQKEADRYLDDFRGSLVALVDRYYRQLDDRSQNGLQPLADRRKFFQDLYTEDELQRTSFKYFDVVRRLLRQVTDESVSKHYLLP